MNFEATCRLPHFVRLHMKHRIIFASFIRLAKHQCHIKPPFEAKCCWWECTYFSEEEWESWGTVPFQRQHKDYWRSLIHFGTNRRNTPTMMHRRSPADVGGKPLNMLLSRCRIRSIDQQRHVAVRQTHHSSPNVAASCDWYIITPRSST